MIHIPRPVRALLVALATLAGLVTLVGTGTTSLAQTSSLGAGGEYFPVTPSRVLDRRVSANSTTRVDVWVPSSGIARSDILAVAANITLADARGRGYVSAAGAGDGDSGASLLNVNGPGDVVPNFGIIGVSDGRLDVDLVTQAGGTSRLIVDVVGYVTTSSHTSSRGSRLISVTPRRVLDTRDTTPIGPRSNRRVELAGRAGVSSSATAAVVNITGINTRPDAASTYLTAGARPIPAGATPTSSNGNYRPGQVVANLAIVELDSAGDLQLYNRDGRLNVAVDVVGYLEPRADESTTGRIVALEAPYRTIDTRAAAFGATKLGARQWEDLSFSDFTRSLTLGGRRLGDQSSLFANVTAVAHQQARAAEPPSSYLTLTPAYADGAYPRTEADSSNINVDEGRTVANAAVVRYGTKAGDDAVVSAFNRRGSTHYLIDAYAVVLD